MTTDLIAAMQSVLRQEADALVAMAEGVDNTWLEAVDVLDRTRRNQGRVVICGVGKSGHVGKKIAASLASTGTPSFFVHATEASHGDLGMIQRGDAVLMITASGGTAELVDTCIYCRDNAIPVILITRNPDSRIGRFANHVLRLPALPEACPNNLAPTTSSTATLAAGDAVTVALMHRASFGKADFGRYHPGGKLGDATRRAADVMIALASTTPTDPGTDMATAATRLATGATLQLAGPDGTPAAFLDSAVLLHLVGTGADLTRSIGEALPADLPSIDATQLVATAGLPSAAIWGARVMDTGRVVGYVAPGHFRR